MEREVQDLLARSLQSLRDARSARSADLARSAGFVEGLIWGLEEVRALTPEESRLWRDRLNEILTETRPETRRRRRTATPRPGTSRVRRVIPGPLEPEAFLDGWARVVAVELYDSFVRIHWSLSPLPSHAMVLGGDLRELDRDTEGLSEADREHQRYTARLTRLYRLIKPSLGDDVGTAYRFKRGHQSGSFELDEQHGTADFYPAVPGAANQLEVAISATAVKVRVPLT